MCKLGRKYQFRHDQYDLYSDGHVIGSSNGLVCIYVSRAELFVANPLTREAKKLPKPQITKVHRGFCWGFGYDSFTDDYKVVLGFNLGDPDGTFFHVFSLKSNVWKFIGEVKYRFIGRTGILCNGVLHWFMNDQNNNRVILSLDLSKEEFKEIPQPDNKRYYDISLGITEECLCIFRRHDLAYPKWVLKNYNGKQSWELHDRELKYDAAHYLRNMKDYRRIKKSFFLDDVQMSWDGKYTVASIFVQSLVSPHVNGKPKRKRQTKYDVISGKLIRGDPPGPSDRA